MARWDDVWFWVVRHGRTEANDENIYRSWSNHWKAQLSDDEKIRRASYVIDNSGSLDLTKNQVQRVFWELKTLARRSD